MSSDSVACGAAGICMRWILNVWDIMLSEDNDIGEYVADLFGDECTDDDSDVDEDDGHNGDDDGSHDE